VNTGQPSHQKTLANCFGKGGVNKGSKRKSTKIGVLKFDLSHEGRFIVGVRKKSISINEKRRWGDGQREETPGTSTNIDNGARGKERQLSEGKTGLVY